MKILYNKMNILCITRNIWFLCTNRSSTYFQIFRMKYSKPKYSCKHNDNRCLLSSCYTSIVQTTQFSSVLNLDIFQFCGGWTDKISQIKTETLNILSMEMSEDFFESRKVPSLDSNSTCSASDLSGFKNFYSYDWRAGSSTDTYENDEVDQQMIGHLIFPSSSSLEFVTEEMLLFRNDLNISPRQRKDICIAAANDPTILIGWQAIFPFQCLFPFLKKI